MRPSPAERLQTDVLLSTLGIARKVDSFRKNQIIFSQGDRSDSLFFIQEGVVKLTVTSKQGKEAVVAILNGGCFFGENALAWNRPPRSNHATALTDVAAVKIAPDSMLRLLKRNSDVSAAFILGLIRLKIQMQEDLATSLLYSAEERLARALLSLQQFNKSAQLRSVLKLNQQTLANMVGISRQRVNVLLQSWKPGSIHVRGGLKVRERRGNTHV